MIVLDTNVVSEPMRPAPDPHVLTWLNSQPAESLYLTSVSLAELLVGIGVIPVGRRRESLARSLDHLLDLFADRVLPFDQAAAGRYADMAVRARAVGQPLPPSDGYVAATAASHGFLVATRNARHFAHTGVEIINPWTAR